MTSVPAASVEDLLREQDDEGFRSGAALPGMSWNETGCPIRMHDAASDVPSRATATMSTSTAIFDVIRSLIEWPTIRLDHTSLIAHSYSPSSSVECPVTSVSHNWFGPVAMTSRSTRLSWAVGAAAFRSCRPSRRTDPTSRFLYRSAAPLCGRPHEWLHRFPGRFACDNKPPPREAPRLPAPAAGSGAPHPAVPRPRSRSFPAGHRLRHQQHGDSCAGTTRRSRRPSQPAIGSSALTDHHDDMVRELFRTGVSAWYRSLRAADEEPWIETIDCRSAGISLRSGCGYERDDPITLLASSCECLWRQPSLGFRQGKPAAGAATSSRIGSERGCAS